MRKSLTVFYVADQEMSSQFYEAVLGFEPVLNVPGMTEFRLNNGSSLGLMPERGIKNLLGDLLPDPARGSGIPRAELYLIVDNAAQYHERAIAAGAKEMSALDQRGWGDRVAYSLDPDGHMLAFAESS